MALRLRGRFFLSPRASPFVFLPRAFLLAGLRAAPRPHPGLAVPGLAGGGHPVLLRDSVGPCHRQSYREAYSKSESGSVPGSRTAPTRPSTSSLQSYQGCLGQLPWRAAAQPLRSNGPESQESGPDLTEAAATYFFARGGVTMAMTAGEKLFSMQAALKQAVWGSGEGVHFRP